MPTFDFSCHECNHQFEHLVLPQPEKQEPLKLACPACDSQKLQKRISAPNLQFKGSGFYVTDSKQPTKDSPSTAASTPTSHAQKKG